MSRSVQAVLFIVLLTIGSIATMVNLERTRLAGIVWSDTATTSLASQVDTATATNVPHWPALEGLLDGLRYRFLEDAGAQVRVGCPGWLFLAEEVQEVPHGEGNLQARLGIAARVADEFRGRGIQLLIVPVPDKIEEAATATCGAAFSPQSAGRMAAWWQGTATLGLRQIDAAAKWPQPGFWRTDTHWDRTGSRYVAELVGAAAGDLLSASDRARVTLKTAMAPHPRPGDLLPLAGLDHSPAWLAPPWDMELDETAEIARTGGLLDAKQGAPVILAGTSYSMNSGFLDYLELAMQSQVLQASELGGGFSGAILDLLRLHPELLAGAKLVIWEWPERALTLPLSAAEETYLKPTP